MISSSLEKIVNELIEMGFSERKIINRLKKIRDEELITNVSSESEKNINKKINSLLYGGKFYIEEVEPELRKYVSNIIKNYGSRFCYYVLSNILLNKYFVNNIHDKDDSEKSYWLLYLIKNNILQYWKDFNYNQSCEEPI